MSGGFCFYIAIPKPDPEDLFRFAGRNNILFEGWRQLVDCYLYCAFQGLFQAR